ncbi:MAG: hypothetical protein ABIO98_10030 [Chitinophagales bacterium]
MKNHWNAVFLSVLILPFTNCQQSPKDSEGHQYEFQCEKRPECNNEPALVQIAYNSINGVPDLTKSETMVFCCDRLSQSIDSLKKFSEMMAPFNDSLKGKTLTREQFDAPGYSVLKFMRAFYFGEDSICIDLSTVFIYDTVFKFKEMQISVGNKRTGRIWLLFNGKKELDEYIKLLEGNYKNCCI